MIRRPAPTRLLCASSLTPTRRSRSSTFTSLEPKPSGRSKSWNVFELGIRIRIWRWRVLNAAY